MPTLKYVLFIALIILVSVFAAKNMHTVEVHFFGGYFADYTVKVPTIILILVSFALGLIIAWVLNLSLVNNSKNQAMIRPSAKETRISIIVGTLTV
jgi:uncharacterized integral membrane protein